ncbi:ESX secretion-associated protein EspG [Amycolatopsis nigrescens]|uniref:ESX secretion-associated protein EspG n=1 Tax=Amycolatopsis nigrescens TaxID=381445 RepID=UPI0003A61ECD|nr:ESX secretion-associated protein EspG [Amycolatopsis nigrescens]
MQNALQVWARPDVLIVGRASQATGSEAAHYRASAAGGVGLLSGQDGERVIFELCDSGSLVDRLLADLPELGPVPVPAGSVLEREDGTDATETGGMRVLRGFMSAPVERFGMFEVSVRGQDGQLDQQGSVQFFDTARGRFMVTTTMLADGARRRDFVPTDGSDIRRWLRERAGGKLAEGTEGIAPVAGEGELRQGDALA